MNAIELLMTDHEEAMNLIEEIEQAELGADMEALFERLRRALTLHAAAEEQYFYPLLKSYPQASDVIEDAYTEHAVVDSLLADMSAMSIDSGAFAVKLEELKEKLQVHVEEEEIEIFPLAQELCGEQALEDCGRRIEELKQSESQPGVR